MAAVQNLYLLLSPWPQVTLQADQAPQGAHTEAWSPSENYNNDNKADKGRQELFISVLADKTLGWNGGSSGHEASPMNRPLVLTPVIKREGFD